MGRDLAESQDNVSDRKKYILYARLKIYTDVRNDVVETCDLGIPYVGLALGLGIRSLTLTLDLIPNPKPTCSIFQRFFYVLFCLRRLVVQNIQNTFRLLPGGQITQRHIYLYFNYIIIRWLHGIGRVG